MLPRWFFVSYDYDTDAPKPIRGMGWELLAMPVPTPHPTRSDMDVIEKSLRNAHTEKLLTILIRNLVEIDPPTDKTGTQKCFYVCYRYSIPSQGVKGEGVQDVRCRPPTSRIPANYFKKVTDIINDVQKKKQQAVDVQIVITNWFEVS